MHTQVMYMVGTYVGSSVTVISSSSSMACLCHTGFASTGSVSIEQMTQKRRNYKQVLVWRSKHDKKNKTQLTYGLVAGHSRQALLLDVRFGGGVAASSVESPVIDA